MKNEQLKIIVESLIDTTEEAGKKTIESEKEKSYFAHISLCANFLSSTLIGPSELKYVPLTLQVSL